MSDVKRRDLDLLMRFLDAVEIAQSGAARTGPKPEMAMALAVEAKREIEAMGISDAEKATAAGRLRRLMSSALSDFGQDASPASYLN